MQIKQLCKKIVRKLTGKKSAPHNPFLDEYRWRDARITELAKNPAVLSDAQVQELTAFWKRYDEHYDVKNHVFFKETRGEYNPYYVPNGFHYMVIDKFYNDWNMALYMDNKCLYNRLLNVRQPELVCSRMNGFWYDAAGNMLTEEQALACMMAQPECFLKIARDSYCGKGVTYFSPETVKDRSHIEECLKSVGTNDFVVQKALKQSPVTAAFAASSVNSLRVYTLLRKDGSVKVYSIILRLGMGNAKVDNAHSGGICIGVSLDGQLADKAYSVSGETFTEHPISHVHFADVKLPNMEKVLDLVAKAHPQLPYFRLVGWDVALDEQNEPVLLEANMAHPGVEVLQLCNGPLFGDDLPAILEEVCGKR